MTTLFRTIGLFLVALLVWPASTAWAHPHVWIDMTVSSIFDEHGKLSGFEHVWTFDEFYTVFQLEGFELEQGNVPSAQQLTDYAVEMTDSIAEFGYLMRIEGKGGRVAVEARKQSAILRGDQRLELTFTVDLEEPADLTQWPVRYSVYDPDYFIQMLHMAETGILMTGKPPKTCTTELETPSPTFEMISLAASLDRMDKGPETLGAAFAENVTIDCRPADARAIAASNVE